MGSSQSLPSTRFYLNHHGSSLSLDQERVAKLREISLGGLLAQVVECVKTFCPRPTRGSILEVGTGRGSNLLILKEHIGDGHYIGTDILPRENWELTDVAYEQVPVEELTKSIEVSSVSLCLLIEVIEHLWSPDDALQQIMRVLEPGGVLIVTTPNLSSGINRVALALGLQPMDTEVSTVRTYGRPGSDSPVGHIRNFTLRALTEMIALNGFELLRQSTAPYLAPATASRRERGVQSMDRFMRAIHHSLGSRSVVVSRKPRTS